MEKNKDLISVIVPIYNVEKYLEKCINSIIEQSYSNIEILLIDDGSKDNSLNICKEFAKSDKRIKVISQKNSGVSVARNKGIEESKGDWIVFVDSDDYLENNMIETLYKRIIETDYDFVITPPIFEFDKVSQRGKIFENEILFNNENKEKLKLNIICRQFNNKFYGDIGAGGPWGKIYRKEFIEKNNLRFKVGLKRMQDVLFNLYAAHASNKVYYSEDYLYHYRINESSVCLKYNPKIFDVFEEVLDELLSFIKNNKKPDYYYQALYLKTVLLYIEGMRIFVLHKDNKVSLYTKIKQMKKIYNKECIKKAFFNIKLKDVEKKLAFFIIANKIRMFLISYFMIKIFINSKKKSQN